MIRAIQRLVALCLSGFFISPVGAVTMYYPGNTDGTTAVEQAAKPPQYYPPQAPNPENPNPNLPRQKYPNSNLQGNTVMPQPQP